MADLYLLRRHLGIEPEDAYYRRPGWVIDLLAEGLRAELGAHHQQQQTDEQPRAAPADWGDLDQEALDALDT